MPCERTKKQRMRWLGARPSEIRTAEDRRLVTANPKLLRDRVEVVEPMWICGPGREESECGVHLCEEMSTHECDGCDIPICSAHATRRGTQEIVVETGFESPGWSRAAFEDSYDLCPFCLFSGDNAPKRKDRA